MAFTFLNVLVLNIAEKLLAGRLSTNQPTNQPIKRCVRMCVLSYFALGDDSCGTCRYPEIGIKNRKAHVGRDKVRMVIDSKQKWQLTKEGSTPPTIF